MTKVLEGYLEGFKTTLLDKIRTDYDNALERHRDELQIISNMHKQELDLLEEELKITKDQNVIMEGRLIRAEKEIDNLKEQYLITEARSMRDNLMFYNIPESSKGAQEDASKTLKSFLADEMRINDEELKQVRFDRVHRIGQKKNDKPRVIVAEFNPSYGKNIVMRHCKNLDRTKRYGVNEQLPRELEERKKHLLPKFREARDAQQKPKWSMDKLIVNDRVTQMKQDCVRDINLNTTDIAASMKIESAPHRTYRKSTFQGHHTAIRTQDDIIPALHAIYALSGVARANHNIYAYRLEAGDQIIEHFSDDREWGAGRKVLELLREHNVTNKLVCVSRWYGGINLGQARFDHIKEAARLTLGLSCEPQPHHQHHQHEKRHSQQQQKLHNHQQQQQQPQQHQQQQQQKHHQQGGHSSHDDTIDSNDK